MKKTFLASVLVLTVLVVHQGQASYVPGGGGVASDANNNTSAGTNAGVALTTGTNNSFFGLNAGTVNTTGFSNTFVGTGTGTANTTEWQNTFLGANAGYSNTANNNTFVGTSAGKANTTGSSNAFLGANAGLSNITGNANTFLGSSAGQTNTAGRSNVFLGINAGMANTIADYNTFLGGNAGRYNTTGASNTFLGSSAGNNNTTGASNIIIGNNIANLTATTSNHLNIGNTIYGDLSAKSVGIGTVTTPARTLHAGVNDAVTNAVTYLQRLTHTTSGTPANNIGVGIEFEAETAAANNEIGATIEAVAADTTALSEDFDIVFKLMTAGATAAEKFRINSVGNVGIGVSAPLEKLDVTGGNIVANAYLYPSDIRLKKNIFPLSGSLEKVQQLQGVSFDWRRDGSHALGLIAQEVEVVVPEAVHVLGNKKNGIKSIKYDHLIPILIEAIKEQQTEIKSLQEQVSLLQTK